MRRLTRWRAGGLVAGLAFLIVIIGGAAWALRPTEYPVVVANRSGQPIALVLVAGPGSCARFARLPDGAEDSATVRVECDGDFYLHGRFWGGTGYGAEFGGESYGYVTPGLGGGPARFVIEPGGRVAFSQGGGRSASPGEMRAQTPKRSASASPYHQGRWTVRGGL